MTADQYSADLRARIRAMRANRPQDVLRITFDLIGQIRLRVQSSGEDFRGRPFDPYTPDYAKQRAKAGYQVGYVDLTRTGRLWASVRPEVIQSTQESTTVEVAPRGQDNVDKARGQVRKRGNIILPSDEELNIAAQANRERIRKYLGL